MQSLADGDPDLIWAITFVPRKGGGRGVGVREGNGGRGPIE